MNWALYWHIALCVGVVVVPLFVAIWGFATTGPSEPDGKNLLGFAMLLVGLVFLVAGGAVVLESMDASLKAKPKPAQVEVVK
jgi:predicted transporter